MNEHADIIHWSEKAEPVHIAKLVKRYGQKGAADRLLVSASVISIAMRDNTCRASFEKLAAMIIAEEEREEGDDEATFIVKVPPAKFAAFVAVIQAMDVPALEVE